MKDFLRHIVTVTLALSCIVGCDNEEEEKADEETPQLSSIGTYAFDGTEYGIVDGYYGEDDYAYYFCFSPQPENSRNTVIGIGIAKTFNGQKMDVGKFYAGDFMFYYEDALHLYPQEHGFKSGSVYVKSLDDKGKFDVNIDAVLPDGKPFRLDFSGVVEKKDPDDIGLKN